MIFSSRLTNGFFCVFGETFSEDWSRFVLITDRTKKGHFWMQRIAETVGKFPKGDWGRSRLITGGNIGGHYCILADFVTEPITAPVKKSPRTSAIFKKGDQADAANYHPVSLTYVCTFMYNLGKNWAKRPFFCFLETGSFSPINVASSSFRKNV